MIFLNTTVILTHTHLYGEHMQGHLNDIVKHILPIGIDLVKITGTPTETTINGILEDRSVVVEAKLKAPMAEFTGTFGMPNLGKLNTILSIPEYKEDAKLTTNTQEKDIEGKKVKVVTGINFVNKANDFKNDYRFMGAEIINDKLKATKFRGVKWNVEFEPTVAAIQRLRYQASANTEVSTFVAKTENGALNFYIGDASSHAGNFTFHNNVTGTLSKAWSWPVNQVLAILALPGDKAYKISDDGASMITVDSGLIEYSYIIPAQSK